MKEGWEYKKFKDISHSISDGDWIEKDDQSNSGIRLIQTGNIGVGKFIPKDGSQRFITEDTFKKLRCSEIFEGDILISRLPNPLGRSCILPRLNTRCITAVDCSIVRIKKEVILPNYFIYYTQSQGYFSKINSESSGTTRARITRKKLELTEIPVPPSFSEQQSIVDYLDSAFEKIDEMKANAEKALDEAQAFFQKVLEEIMSSKEGWEEKPLGELCDIFGRIGFRGYTTKDLVQSPSDGAISLSPSNIQDGKMNYSKLTYISWFKYEESPEIKIFNGDILLVKTGSSYGKSALVQGLPHEATINPQSVVLKNCKIDNAFFAYQLQTNRVHDEFNRFVSGTAIPTFSQAKLSTVPIQYPTNDKQQSIVSTLDSIKSKVDRLQENFDKISRECDALKQALLRKVFE